MYWTPLYTNKHKNSNKTISPTNNMFMHGYSAADNDII